LKTALVFFDAPALTKRHSGLTPFRDQKSLCSSCDSNEGTANIEELPHREALRFGRGPLEPHGPRQTIPPGASVSFTEDWYLLEHKFPVAGEEIDLEKLAARARRVNAACRAEVCEDGMDADFSFLLSQFQLFPILPM